MLKKNNILFFVVFLFFIIFSFNNKVLAATEDANTSFTEEQVNAINSVYKEYMNEYDSFFTRYHQNVGITIFMFNNVEDNYFYDSGGDTIVTTKDLDVLEVDIDVTTYEVLSINSYSGVNRWYCHAINGKCAIYGNVDVYKDSSFNDLYYSKDFFCLTPETALAKITRESHPEEVMIQILKIIPLILVVVVSFLGFRKAWSLLSKILRGA